jgi:hypothetical protein
VASKKWPPYWAVHLISGRDEKEEEKRRLSFAKAPTRKAPIN